ncbi:MAG: hypothetical protein JO358_08365, partial [Alphaproteobacteria bacterium]|nr:hypothetical protein [Alphaproteobacteria bacterium]
DYLLDPNGVVGRLYDARATPTMVVVNRDGRVAYIGAIDDTPSTRLADVEPAKNYVVAALDEMAAGKPVTIAATCAYGCSIKYRGPSAGAPFFTGQDEPGSFVKRPSHRSQASPRALTAAQSAQAIASGQRSSNTFSARLPPIKRPTRSRNTVRVGLS